MLWLIFLGYSFKNLYPQLGCDLLSASSLEPEQLEVLDTMMVSLQLMGASAQP
jgi:hypothetical protein